MSLHYSLGNLYIGQEDGCRLLTPHLVKWLSSLYRILILTAHVIWLHGTVVRSKSDEKDLWFRWIEHQRVQTTRETIMNVVYYLIRIEQFAMRNRTLDCFSAAANEHLLFINFHKYVGPFQRYQRHLLSINQNFLFLPTFQGYGR